MLKTIVQLQIIGIFKILSNQLEYCSFFKFSIKDFGDILFAENDRRSKV